MTPEAAARERIDARLTESGRVIQNNGPLNPSAGRRAAGGEVRFRFSRVVNPRLVFPLAPLAVSAARNGAARDWKPKARSGDPADAQRRPRLVRRTPIKLSTLAERTQTTAEAERRLGLVPEDGERVEATIVEMSAPRFLYVFLDEGGNFDFSPHGTRYFVMSSLAKERPFFAGKELSDLKYDLVEGGANLEYFHAAEDRQAVRDAVFGVIAKHLAGVRVDSLIVEKRKTGPALQAVEKFYPRMLGYLLKHVLAQHDLHAFAEVLLFTDTIPVNRQRQAVEKAVKTTLTAVLPAGTRFRTFHHASKSCIDLQIADYCNWAIYRKWDRGDERSFNIIRSVVQSEFDIFRTGTTTYY